MLRDLFQTPLIPAVLLGVALNVAGVTLPTLVARPLEVLVGATRKVAARWKRASSSTAASESSAPTADSRVSYSTRRSAAPGSRSAIRGSMSSSISSGCAASSVAR